jgi:hypothetical protein
MAKAAKAAKGAKPQRKVRKSGRKPNNLRFDGTEPVFRALGVDLTAIEGIEAPTAPVILGEIGVDVSKFPTEKHAPIRGSFQSAPQVDSGFMRATGRKIG